MRPVNLLPEGRRPRAGGGTTGNGPKVVLGVLCALLVMVAGYVFTVNQVNSRETEIAETRAAADAARARADALAPYARLAAIKQTRTASVSQLAGGRFDWERLMRELAMVLPDGSWLLELTADTGGEDAASTGAAPEPGANAGGGTPTVKLKGCSPSQPDVATLLVRLRKLNGVADVQLNESLRDDDDEGGSEPAASGGSGGASGDDCAGNFRFEVTIMFEAPQAVVDDERPERVPAALGGGQ